MKNKNNFQKRQHYALLEYAFIIKKPKVESVFFFKYGENILKKF